MQLGTDNTVPTLTGLNHFCFCSLAFVHIFITPSIEDFYLECAKLQCGLNIIFDNDRICR